MTYHQRKLLYHPFAFVIKFSWNEVSQESAVFVPTVISYVWNCEKWKDGVGIEGKFILSDLG
jgi:hypothetical protein